MRFLTYIRIFLVTKKASIVRIYVFLPYSEFYRMDTRLNISMWGKCFVNYFKPISILHPKQTPQGEPEFENQRENPRFDRKCHHKNHFRQGSISPNFFRQAHSFWWKFFVSISPTLFNHKGQNFMAKKWAFCQMLVTFCQTLLALCPICMPKKLIILYEQKAMHIC